MKSIKFVLPLASFLAGVAFVFSACNDKGNLNAPGQINLDAAQFAVIAYGDVLNAVEDGSPDKDMTFNSAMLTYGFAGGDRGFGPGDPSFRGMPWFDHFNFGKHMGLFFRQLNLTDDQKTQVRDLAKVFQQNMKPLVAQFYAANKAIIDSANVSRRQIMDDVKSGKITRADAASKITALNQATRSLIQSNPASQSVKAAMCNERDKLFAGVKAILVGDQITKWNTWVSNIQNPCTP
jgi:hypothetical protein